MAVSPSAIATSTFLWNSNIVGPSAALATASGWHAWRTRQPRWWFLSAAATVLVVHGHTLAAVGVLPLIVLFVADLLRRPRRPRRQVIWVLVGTSLIVAAGLVPFFVFELRHDFPRRAPSSTTCGMALPHTAQRRVNPRPSGDRLAHPRLAGIRKCQRRPAVSATGGFFTVAALTVAATGTAGVAKQFGKWAMATTVWAVVALTLAAPNLGVIHSGLPNDQYHAWLDPIILAAIGVAAAWLWGARSTVLKAAATTVVLACLTLSIVSMPPFTSARGGWPSAAEAADRIRAVTDDHPTAVTGVYKTGAAVEFPLRRAGSRVVDPSVAEFLVVTCDPLFERAVGIPCGGPAEAARAFMAGFAMAETRDCFANGPRRYICIFHRR